MEEDDDDSQSVKRLSLDDGGALPKEVSKRLQILSSKRDSEKHVLRHTIRLLMTRLSS
jgi:hypothetical protein